MSSQGLNSQKIQDGLKDTLLGPAQLYEALPARSYSSAIGAMYPIALRVQIDGRNAKEITQGELG